eukprot:5134371-Amphidinium_carterae.1
MPVVATMLSATITSARAYPHRWIVKLSCSVHPPCLLPICKEKCKTRDAIGAVFKDLAHEVIMLDLKDIPTTSTTDWHAQCSAIRRRALTFGHAIGAVLSDDGVLMICCTPDAFPHITQRFPDHVDTSSCEYLTALGATDLELDRSTLPRSTKLATPTTTTPTPPAAASTQTKPPTTTVNPQRKRMHPAGHVLHVSSIVQPNHDRAAQQHLPSLRDLR